MADFILKVSPEEMIAQAERVKAGVDNVARQFEAVGERVRGSVSYWEGVSSSRHVVRFDKIREKYETLAKCLRKRPDDLLKMAGLYNENEQSVTEASEALPGSILD